MPINLDTGLRTVSTDYTPSCTANYVFSGLKVCVALLNSNCIEQLP